MKTPQVVVYTRDGCHLCDDACELLQAYGLEPQLVNIDTDKELVDAFGFVIPVVVINGVERFRGRVDEVLLRRLLKAGWQ